MDYPRPSLTVDAIVLAGSGENMRILVIERARDPFQGYMALPGGFVDPDESPYLACLRELQEETGLVLPNPLPLPLRLRARKGRDARGWTLSQPFLFSLADPLPVQGGDDAKRAEWVALADLDRLAFDHGAMLCEALGRFWQEMPGSFAILKGRRGFGAPPAFPKQPLFYGGSFNPLHDGHRACAVLTAEPANLIVVPDSNPFKPLTELDCAWRSYRALREVFEAHALAVYPGFWGMELPNPTVSWLPLVPGDLGMVIGEDSLVGLPRWTEAQTLVGSLARLLIVPRRADLERLAQSLDWLKEHAPTCQVIHLPHHPFRDLSSSALREGKA